MAKIAVAAAMMVVRYGQQHLFLTSSEAAKMTRRMPPMKVTQPLTLMSVDHTCGRSRSPTHGSP